jgi:TRCF domain
MKLLEQAVKELKGEEIEDEVRATVNLRVDLKIEDSYIPDMNQRLIVYRRIASARHDEQLDRVLEEVRDRYGALPASVLNLAEYGRIRIKADRLRIETVDREASTVVIKFRETARVDPERLVHLVRRRTDLTMVPPASLRLDLRHRPVVPAGVLPGRADTGKGRAASPRPPLRPGALREGPAVSWWTARAKSGEVAPGFSREEILRPAPEDPRGEDGVFTKVGGLLSELLG